MTSLEVLLSVTHGSSKYDMDPLCDLLLSLRASLPDVDTQCSNI